MVESGQFGGLRIWNKKLKKWLLWGTGMIWRKFSICSRKNNPIQPCKIHLFFPYIFGGQFFLTGSLLFESPNVHWKQNRLYVCCWPRPIFDIKEGHILDSSYRLRFSRMRFLIGSKKLDLLLYPYTLRDNHLQV